MSKVDFYEDLNLRVFRLSFLTFGIFQVCDSSVRWEQQNGSYRDQSANAASHGTIESVTSLIFTYQTGNIKIFNQLKPII